MLKKAAQRSVRRDSLNVKGCGERVFGSPMFHLLPFTGLESDTRTPLAEFFSILLDLSKGALPMKKESVWQSSQ